jgi:hypothetical protein
LLKRHGIRFAPQSHVDAHPSSCCCPAASTFKLIFSSRFEAGRVGKIMEGYEMYLDVEHFYLHNNCTKSASIPFVFLLVIFSQSSLVTSSSTGTIWRLRVTK